LESKKESECVVGLREGGLLRLNTLEPEQRVRYEGIVNGPVERITPVRGKNWLVLSHPTAMAIYSPDE
jgi:hypothetical protein